MNDLILSKWEPSGLIYIKEQAWKAAERLGYTFENAWGNKTVPQIYEQIESHHRQFRQQDKEAVG
jgi:hypothetical protein